MSRKIPLRLYALLKALAVILFRLIPAQARHPGGDETILERSRWGVRLALFEASFTNTDTQARLEDKGATLILGRYLYVNFSKDVRGAGKQLEEVVGAYLFIGR